MSFYDSIDWNERGAVTPVKDQGSCTVAAVEGLNKIRTGAISVTFGAATSGLLHPKRGRQDYYCDGWRSSASWKYGAIRGYQYVQPATEEGLQEAVSRQPVSVAIDATWFNFYHGGVFTGPCGNTPNHGVTIVGYGTTTEAEGQHPYWLVKNRWGTNWGEGGSMRIFRGVGGSIRSLQYCSQCCMITWPIEAIECQSPAPEEGDLFSLSRRSRFFFLLGVRVSVWFQLLPPLIRCEDGYFVPIHGL
ncbi:cysteine protease 1 [Citrus sinensis]|nr:cysteine protease 1 [Citrus sinensis]